MFPVWPNKPIHWKCLVYRTQKLCQNLASKTYSLVVFLNISESRLVINIEIFSLSLVILALFAQFLPLPPSND